MLWDLIRDFFVQHVFGGVSSTGLAYAPFFGHVANNEGGWDIATTEIGIKFNNFYDLTDGSQVTYMSIGDYLSTTATAIAITIIVVLCCLFIYKIIKLIGGLIR